uniref:Uncharacterized protein n=1 Tax=Candidatus Kentrum sp. MB TaxID=2138164 RepID=A0A450XHF5_9GAMM|nr:MAG: hypothetical protein BECKMB1821G_GA0114241_104022 [Candidatus Kentron sp. MB]
MPSCNRFQSIFSKLNSITRSSNASISTFLVLSIFSPFWLKHYLIFLIKTLSKALEIKAKKTKINSTVFISIAKNIFKEI